MIERPFWSDTFDMDLPRAIPEAAEIVGDLADVALWTTGRTADGALNHADVWNGEDVMLAFFGFSGPCRPEGYRGSPGLVRCTFWEALRDAWPHQYLMTVERAPVWNTGVLWPQFQTIVKHVRGWDGALAHEADAARASVRVSLHSAVARFLRLATEHGDRVQRFPAAAAPVPPRPDPESLHRIQGSNPR